MGMNTREDRVKAKQNKQKREAEITATSEKKLKIEQQSIIESTIETESYSKSQDIINGEIEGIGSWKEKTNVQQINFTTLNSIVNLMDKTGTGTKNIKNSYFLLLGIFCARLIAQKTDVDITEKSLTRLIDDLSSNPSFLKTLL